MIVEWKLFRAGDFKVNVRNRSRGLTRQPNHLVGNVDAFYPAVECILSKQASRPSRSAAHIQHASIRRDPHPRNRLLANGPMALLHALALASAGPFVEFGSEL